MKLPAGAPALLLILCACLTAVPAGAETVHPGLTFSLTPGVSIPIGPGADYFSVGGGGELLVEYPLALAPGLTLRGGLGYGVATLQYGAGTTSEIAALAGAAWGVPLFDGLSARIFAGAGYSYGFVNGDDPSRGGGGAVMEAGAGLAYSLNPLLALRLDVSYLYYAGAYGSLGFALGTAVSIPGTAPAAPQLPSRPAPLGLEITGVSLGEVFPAILSAYSSRPVGTAVVRNAGPEPLTNVLISFLAPGSMDGATESPPIPVLGPRESQTVPLYARFNTSLTRAGEPMSVPAEVHATAASGEQQLGASRSARLPVSRRDRIPWDEPESLAAFIQPEERAVQDLSGSSSEAAARLYNPGLDRNLQASIALLETLRAAGVAFAPDSRSPYALASRAPLGSGSVRYPGQTLRSRSGDQPDLVVLCASLLESAGIETAILSVPGHLMLAARLGQSAAAAAESLRGLPGLIMRDGAAWVPLDPSVRGGEFLAAWEQGALLWDSLGAAPSASFIPVREARAAFAPLDHPSPDLLALAPSPDTVARAFTRGLAPIVDRQWNAAAKTARQSQKGSALVAQGEATPRRLLLSVEASGDTQYSELDSLSIEKSIALALRTLDGIVVIEQGPPQADAGGLEEAARAAGADCWLRAEIGGERSAPVVRVQLYDLTARSLKMDNTVSRDAGLDAREAAREGWQDLVSSVSRIYQAGNAAGARTADTHGILLTLHALSGTRISGGPGGPIVTGRGGTAGLRLQGAAACTLDAELSGYFPAERSVFVDADRDLYFSQEPMSLLSVETGFQDAFSPTAAAVLSFIPQLAFLRLGITSFGFALALNGDQAVRSIPLWNLSLQAGLYFLPADSPVRLYAGLGPFLRLVRLPGTSFRVDPLTPGGALAALGVEVRVAGSAYLFLEYTPLLYWSRFPDLLRQSLTAYREPAGYLFTPVGAVSLVSLRFGARWQL